MMTDPIADLLTRIRNANRIERPVADMPATMMIRSVGCPTWSAATTPMNRLNGTTSRNATAEPQAFRSFPPRC